MQPHHSTALKPTRQRVLVEDPDPDWQRFATEALEGDYELDYCAGPTTLRDGCPLLAGKRCPKVEQADVILNTLDFHRPDNRRLVEELRRRYPGSLVELRAECPVG